MAQQMVGPEHDGRTGKIAQDAVAEKWQRRDIACRQAAHRDGVESPGNPDTEVADQKKKLQNLEGGLPTISNIHGAEAHKVLWFDIQQIQLRQDQGKKIRLCTRICRDPHFRRLSEGR